MCFGVYQWLWKSVETGPNCDKKINCVVGLRLCISGLGLRSARDGRYRISVYTESEVCCTATELRLSVCLSVRASSFASLRASDARDLNNGSARRRYLHNPRADWQYTVQTIFIYTPCYRGLIPAINPLRRQFTDLGGRCAWRGGAKVNKTLD